MSHVLISAAPLAPRGRRGCADVSSIRLTSDELQTGRAATCCVGPRVLLPVFARREAL
jgi:hypothetical protein